MRDKKKHLEDEVAEKTNVKKNSLIRFFTPVSAQEFQTNNYTNTRKFLIFQVVSLVILLAGLAVTIILSHVQINRNIGTLIPTYQVKSELHNLDFSDDWDYYDNVTGEVRSNVNVVDTVFDRYSMYNTSKKVKNGGNPFIKKGEVTRGVTISKVLPDIQSPHYVLSFIIGNGHYTAWVDCNDDGVFTEGYDYYQEEHYYQGENDSACPRLASYWDYIQLNQGCSGRRIYITLYSNGFGRGSLSFMNYGTLDAAFSRQYRTIARQLFIAIALFTFTFVLFVLSFFNKFIRENIPQFFIISLFGIMYATYSVITAGYFQINTGNLYTYRLAARILFHIATWILTHYYYLKAHSNRMVNFCKGMMVFEALMTGLVFIGSFTNIIDLLFIDFISYTAFYSLAVAGIINAVRAMKINKTNFTFLLLNIILFAIDLMFVLLEFNVKTGVIAEFIDLIGITVFVTLALSFEFNKNFIKSKNIIENQKAESDAKMSIMLAQIKPHFLYNTLNSIAILCESNPKQARDLTIRFAKYLRNNMNSLSYEYPVPFTQALEILRNYLEIEKIRFSNKLKVIENIHVTDFYIPVLTIQPLCENAVKHGIAKKPTVGTLTVTTFDDKYNYYIQIEDDGVGFDPKIVEEKSKSGQSIGLENVRGRLKTMVGGELTISSTINVGTKVVVTLPKKFNGPQGIMDGGA